MSVNNATQWARVGALFIAGCATTFHIGKVPVAIPQLSVDLGLTLVSSSWIISLFSILIALFGMLAGATAGRLTYRNAAISGLLLSSLASISGAHADGLVILLILRTFEGLGWILAAVSLPALLISVSHENDRPVVLGLWGAFVPAGMAATMFVAPAILDWVGWRGLWIATGLASAAGVLLVYFSASGVVAATGPRVSLSDAVNLISQRAPLSAFLCFFVYSAQFLAVTSFMPIFLLETASIDIKDAARLSALIVLANVIGNVASGLLLGKGVSRYRILTFALTSMLVLSVVVFMDWAALPLRILAALGFTAVSGLIPGTLFATAPLLVRDISQLGIINGLVLQASGMGQMLGPVILATLVEFSQSWSVASVFTAIACVTGLFSVRALRSSNIEQQNLSTREQ